MAVQFTGGKVALSILAVLSVFVGNYDGPPKRPRTEAAVVRGKAPGSSLQRAGSPVVSGGLLRAGLTAPTEVPETLHEAESKSELSRGRFKFLTYNVAGLPEGISASNPSANMPLIGQLLNEYDLALVQEDFAYAKQLRKNVLHPYMSAPFVHKGLLNFGDGLSRFSKLPFSELTRKAWDRCHGYLSSRNDCLTPKGFSVARHQLGSFGTVDVYNLHMDSGFTEEDTATRRAQVDELAAAIRKNSAGEAVIVAGDTNIFPGELSFVKRFERQSGLRNVCIELGCREQLRIDRVFYRGSKKLELLVKSWKTDPRFIDERQKPLSDHLAVAVEFEWAVPATGEPNAEEQPNHHASRR